MKSLISIFQGFSSSIGSFHFVGGAGRWAIVLSSLDGFLMFPNFLES